MDEADPVSWLMIRPGWDVYGADGTKVGEVDEVAGDDTVDIFDGLAIASSALAKPQWIGCTPTPARSAGTAFSACRCNKMRMCGDGERLRFRCSELPLSGLRGTSRFAYRSLPLVWPTQRPSFGLTYAEWTTSLPPSKSATDASTATA